MTVIEEYSVAEESLNLVEVRSARPPFGYYGSKHRIAPQIIAMLPPHHAWVEAFCGSAAVTLAKPPAPIEVINDKDGEIVNLFNQLRNNHHELLRAVELTPYARAEYKFAREEPDTDDPLERARRFLVIAMMTVNGTVGDPRCGFSCSASYSRGNKEARVSRWHNLPERLDKVVERLRSVRIENRDARDVVKMFSDRPATLIYLDPPYFTERSHEYVIDANYREFHDELLTLCDSARCMILISAYECDLYSQMLTPERGWLSTTIETHTRGVDGGMHARTEVLWKNALFVEAQESRSVPITLTAKEQAQNKLNPKRP